MACHGVKFSQQRQSGKSSLINTIFGVEMAVNTLFFESSFRLSNPCYFYRRHQKVSTETPTRISTSPFIQTTTVTSQYTSILDSSKEVLSACRLSGTSSRITGTGAVQTWRDYMLSGRLIPSLFTMGLMEATLQDMCPYV
jgi:hypothetical protein